jgi:hypothetical protein
MRPLPQNMAAVGLFSANNIVTGSGIHYGRSPQPESITFSEKGHSGRIVCDTAINCVYFAAIIL